MRFQPHWRLTLFVTVLCHLLLLMGVVFAVQHWPMAKPPTPSELEVVDLPTPPMSLSQPDKPTTKMISKPSAPSLPIKSPDVVAESIPETTKAIPLPPAPTSVPKELPPKLVQKSPTPQETTKVPVQPAPTSTEPSNPKVGALILAGKTPDTRGTDYRGTIDILISLNEDGRVTGHFFTQSSGRALVDQLVLNAVLHFRFAPALDVNGRPMPSIRLLRFTFDGSDSHTFEDDEDRKVKQEREMMTTRNKTRSSKNFSKQECKQSERYG